MTLSSTGTQGTFNAWQRSCRNMAQLGRGQREDDQTRHILHDRQDLLQLLSSTNEEPDGPTGTTSSNRTRRPARRW